MSAVMSPILVGVQQFNNSGQVLSGGNIYTYTAGTTTPSATYTDNTLGTPNANPIVLDSAGRLPAEIWWNSGTNFKFIVKDSSGNTISTLDNLTGINDTAASTPSEWTASGLTPTFVNATSFTIPGNQASTIPVNIRLKTTNTGGTIYSTATVVSYNSGTGLTTITVANDSGTLDSGLSAVSYGFIRGDHPSTPPFSDAQEIVQNATDATKILKLSAAGLTTATTRTGTVPDSNFNLGSPRGYIDGLTMSTAGSSATMTIAAGMARDSTNVADMALAASIQKTTSAWAVGTGNGGLDTGAIANTTRYFWWLITRPDTNVSDVLFSLSATAPTMPANYTQKRLIGAMKTNGSAQWVQFQQVMGNQFMLKTPLADYAATPGVTTRTLVTVSAPPNTLALLRVGVTDGAAAAANVIITPTYETDQSPSISASPGGSVRQEVISSGMNVEIEVFVDASSQIALRTTSTTAAISIICKGYIDPRGTGA